MAGCLLGASDPREKGNAAVATIYKVHYDNVPVDVEPGLMKANIGSSLSEDPNYWGSMSERGEALMRDDHARRGCPSCGGARSCGKVPPTTPLLSREYALITAHRTNIPAYGYNLMPALPGVNLALVFHWDKPRSPIRSTTDCRYGVYTIHLRGEPEFWTKFTDLDGTTEEVYRGPHASKA
jgi:hypothetical protein